MSNCNLPCGLPSGLKTLSGRARKLRGSGYIDYEISKDGNRLCLKITGPDDEGTSTKDPIYLCDLLGRIDELGGCFKSEDLRKVIGTSNNNDPGFVIAILKDIGFVGDDATKKDRYCRLRKTP